MSDAAEIINMVQDADGRFTPQSVERMERGAKGLVPKLLKVAGKIPFADDLAAAYFAARDPDTPLKAKGVLFAAAAYFVMPINLMPDFLAGLGFTDDATVLATALGIVGMHVKDVHRGMARRLLRMPEPVRRED